MSRGVGAVFEQSHGHVAGAAAEVEGDGLGMLKDGAEDAGGAGPPGAVDAGGEEMVGAVVGGGDGVEHLLDVRGGSSVRRWRRWGGLRWRVRVRVWRVLWS